MNTVLAVFPPLTSRTNSSEQLCSFCFHWFFCTVAFRFFLIRFYSFQSLLTFPDVALFPTHLFFKGIFLTFGVIHSSWLSYLSIKTENRRALASLVLSKGLKSSD